MKHRRAAKVDDNQAEIVARLRALEGVTVELGHDDFLVGYQGRTFWIELKNPSRRNADGTWKAGALKSDQLRIALDFTGHYLITDSFDDIVKQINFP